MNILNSMAAFQQQTLSMLAQAHNRSQLDVASSSSSVSRPNQPVSLATSPLLPHCLPPSVSLTAAPTISGPQEAASYISSASPIATSSPWLNLAAPPPTVSLATAPTISVTQQGSSSRNLGPSIPTFQFDLPQPKLTAQIFNPEINVPGLSPKVPFQSPSVFPNLQTMPPASRPIVSPRPAKNRNPGLQMLPQNMDSNQGQDGEFR